LSKQQFINK